MGEGKEGPEGEIQQRQNQPSAPQAKAGVGASSIRLAAGPRTDSIATSNRDQPLPK